MSKKQKLISFDEYLEENKKQDRERSLIHQTKRPRLLTFDEMEINPIDSKDKSFDKLFKRYTVNKQKEEEEERERGRLKRVRTLVEPYSIEFKDKKSQYQYDKAMNKDMFNTWTREKNQFYTTLNLEDLDLSIEKMRLEQELAMDRYRLSQKEIDKRQKEIDDFDEDNQYQFDLDNVRVVNDTMSNLFSSKKSKKTKRSTRKKTKKRKMSKKRRYSTKR